MLKINLRSMLLLVMLGLGYTQPSQGAENLVLNLDRVVKITGVITADILFKADKLLELSNESKEPITLLINSPGGYVSPGMLFMNAMNQVKARGVKLQCLVTSFAASMAFVILANCDTRYALPDSLLLWHPVRVGGDDLTTAKLQHLLFTMQSIEAEMLTTLPKALGMNLEIFSYHFYMETLWRAKELMTHAPKFLTLVSSVKGLDANFYSSILERSFLGYKGNNSDILYIYK